MTPTSTIAGREVGVQSSCLERDGSLYANILIRQSDGIPMYGRLTTLNEDITFHPTDEMTPGHLTVVEWRKFVVANLDEVKALILSTLP